MIIRKIILNILKSSKLIEKIIYIIEDIAIIELDNKKIALNIRDINFLNFEIRDSKIDIIKYYINNLNTMIKFRI